MRALTAYGHYGDIQRLLLKNHIDIVILTHREHYVVICHILITQERHRHQILAGLKSRQREYAELIGYSAVESARLIVCNHHGCCLERLTVGIFHGTADRCGSVLCRCPNAGKQQHKQARKPDESE